MYYKFYILEHLTKWGIKELIKIPIISMLMISGCKPLITTVALLLFFFIQVLFRFLNVNVILKLSEINKKLSDNTNIQRH